MAAGRGGSEGEEQNVEGKGLESTVGRSWWTQQKSVSQCTEGERGLS